MLIGIGKSIRSRINVVKPALTSCMYANSSKLLNLQESRALRTARRIARTVSIAVLPSASTALALAALAPPKAYAWFDICNNTQKEIVVAFAYPDVIDERDIKADYDAQVQVITPRTHTKYAAEGWHRQRPGQCSRVFPHELWRRGYTYHYYAKSLDGTLNWESDHLRYKGSRFCISNSRFKSYQRIDGACEPGKFPQGFKRISVPYKAQNYTLRLSQ